MGDEALPDPLYRHTKLEHTVTLPVLGHLVTYATNARPVLSLVEQAYGRWRNLPDVYRSEKSFSIDLVRHEGRENETEPVFTYRMPVPERLLVKTNGSLGVVEVDRQRAYAYVTNDLLRHANAFRVGVLDALTLMLATSADRCPLHGAAVKTTRGPVLFLGASGSGKSTLAYALHAAGYQVVSDDTVYVQLERQPCVWCVGQHITLLPATAAKFADLRGASPQLLPTGKTKIVIPLSDADRPEPFCEMPFVFVLDRADTARVDRLDSAEMFAALALHVEPGFDLLSKQRGPALEWLVARGGWKLTLSSNVLDALPLIEAIVSH